MSQTHKTYAKGVGTGRYLPNAPIGNAELVARMAAKGVETSDEWIRERSGITQRYWANDDQPVSVLAEFAARQALDAAGMDASELDFIIIGSSTPDMIFPSAACLLQSKLGAKNAAALDVQAACTGFVYALTVANAMIQSGQIKTALVIGAETISDILDEQDRTTAVLFGDGAGAVVLVCLTDRPEGLAKGIEALPIPDVGLLPEEWFVGGIWPKLGIYDRHFHGLKGRAVFIDLDMVVLRDLDAFFDMPGTYIGIDGVASHHHLCHFMNG